MERDIDNEKGHAVVEAVGIWEDSVSSLFSWKHKTTPKISAVHKHTQNEIEIVNYAKQTRLICLMLIFPRYVLCC